MAADVASAYDLDALNADFERRDALDIIDWAAELRDP